jgi:hypothetical protein
MPAITASGDYWVRVEAKKEDFYTVQWKQFWVTRGGPYDVGLNMLEYEVYPSDYLDFEATIINKGDVAQDVSIEYWVSSSSTNQTWWYYNESILTPAATNVTVLRSAYIYSSQPLGFYTLNAKVTYDTVLQPVSTAATFQVIQKPPTVVPPVITPGGGAAGPVTPAPTLKRNISITEYPAEIRLARGWEDVRSVKVTNTGETALDINFTIVGIPTPWFEVNPPSSKSVPPGNETVFIIKFKIPQNAITGEYRFQIIASSGTIGDGKDSKLIIFQSQAELIESELELTKEKYDSLVNETELAEKYGKEVSAVKELLPEIKKYTDQAESSLAEKKYDTALENIAAANALIERAQKLLSEAKFRIEIIERGIPLWQIILVVVILAAVNIVVILWRTKKYRNLEIREQMARIKGAVSSLRREGTKSRENQAEIDKTKKFLALLEKEKKEGIIGDATYKELKKRSEEKLKKLKG